MSSSFCYHYSLIRALYCLFCGGGGPFSKSRVIGFPGLLKSLYSREDTKTSGLSFGQVIRKF